MKKRIIFVALACLALAGIVRSSVVVYNTTLVNDVALGTNNTYVLDLNNPPAGAGQGIDQISFQAVYSSASPTAISFIDGVRSTSSIIVLLTTNLTAVKSTNTITVTATANLAAVAATDQITVASNTALSGRVLTFTTPTQTYLFTEGVDWFKQATASGTAQSIANMFGALSITTATITSNVVFTTATALGSIGNLYTLTSSTPAALTVLTSSFTGGRAAALDNAVITFNGTKYRNGYDWFVQATSSDTAVSIANLFGTIAQTTAAANGSVVTATATTTGTVGNGYTLSASTSALTIGSANFTNGRDNALVTINSIVLTQGTDWMAVATASGTAKAISDAIQANSSLSAIVASTWSVAGIVTTTSTVVGTGTNYSISATPANSFTIPGLNYTGGQNNDVSTTTISINKANLFGTALQVLFANTAGTSPANLVSGTTYFAIPVSTISFKLAASAANAVAGTAISISTTLAAGGGSFSLTPLAITGTPSFKWQVSNDNSNWFDLAVTSVTMSSLGLATTMWDFGTINHRFVRLNVLGPTAGGITLKVTGNGKHSNP